MLIFLYLFGTLVLGFFYIAFSIVFALPAIATEIVVTFKGDSEKLRKSCIMLSSHRAKKSLRVIKQSRREPILKMKERRYRAMAKS